MICRPAALVMMLSALAVTGCNTGGTLSIRSVDDPDLAFKRGFETGLYRLDGNDAITVLLYDGPIDRPTQALTIRMLWPPRNARTPLDPNATNATIRYVMLAGPRSGRIGVYSGAGYLYPKGRLGKKYLSVRVRQANLRLTDADDEFIDPLGPANLSGSFKVKRADGDIESALRRISVLVSQQLGYPQFVSADRLGNSPTTADERFNEINPPIAR